MCSNKQIFGTLGWKNKDIEEKLIKAWKDRENVMQSQQAPLNIQDLWVKATDFLRNLFNKGLLTSYITIPCTIRKVGQLIIGWCIYKINTY